MPPDKLSLLWVKPRSNVNLPPGAGVKVDLLYFRT